MRESVYKLEAYRIVSELANRTNKSESFIVTSEFDRPDLVARYVRDQSHEFEWADRMTTAVDGKMLFVRIKPRNRIQVLEGLIARMMNKIEDEKLFEECMEELYGKNG